MTHRPVGSGSSFSISSSDGELREVFKVAGKSSGSSGVLYVQQVQVTGES